MIGTLTWELCRRSDQTVLATLDKRLPGAKVDITRHAARAAQVALSLDDAAAPLVSEGDTLLRCKVSGWTVPLFVGRVTQRQLAYDGGQAMLLVSALDPWAQLIRALVFATGVFGAGIYSWKKWDATEQATIMWNLINLAAANGHGIVAGSLPASVTRSLSFPAGSAIADDVLSVANLFNGPEFELTPKEATNGDLATFNVYHPRQGADKSGSITLKIGIDKNDNLTQFSYTPGLDAMSNRHTVVGDAAGSTNLGGVDYPTHPAYRAEHAASIASYGVWETSEFLSGTIDASILQASAQAIVGANAVPIKNFGVVLDPDNGPDFGPAGLWMGDTIALQAGLPKETLSLQGRIATASVVENEPGDCDVALGLDPDSSAGVTGSTLTVVVDAGEGTVPPPPPELAGVSGGGAQVTPIGAVPAAALIPGRK